MQVLEDKLDGSTISNLKYEDDDNSEKATFKIYLTQSQMKIAQSRLPSNYVLKLFNQIISNHEKSSKSKSIKPIKSEKDSSILNTSLVKTEDQFGNNQNCNSNEISSSKRIALREKKAKLSYDHKYPDLEAPISGMKFKSNNEGLKKCWKILQQIKKHQYAEPFMEPVDPELLNLPDYLDVIKEPMDLSTIEKKFKNNQYFSVQQFYQDMKKIFSNSWLYNQQGSDIYIMTTELSNYFYKLYKEVDRSQQKDMQGHKKSYMKDNLMGNTGIHSSYMSQIERFQRQVENLSAEIQQLRGGSAGKQKKAGKGQKHHGGYDKPLNTTEKRQLGASIRKLAPEYLRGVWEIVSSGQNIQESGKEELEFDIDTLPVYKARELEKYVKAKLILSNKSQKKKRGKNKNKISNFDNNNNLEEQIYANQSLQYPSDYLTQNQDQPQKLNNINQDSTKQDQFAKSSDSSFITDSDDSL